MSKSDQSPCFGRRYGGSNNNACTSAAAEQSIHEDTSPKPALLCRIRDGIMLIPSFVCRFQCFLFFSVGMKKGRLSGSLEVKGV